MVNFHYLGEIFCLSVFESSAIAITNTHYHSMVDYLFVDYLFVDYLFVDYLCIFASIEGFGAPVSTLLLFM